VRVQRKDEYTIRSRRFHLHEYFDVSLSIVQGGHMGFALEEIKYNLSLFEPATCVPDNQTITV